MPWNSVKDSEIKGEDEKYYLRSRETWEDILSNKGDFTYEKHAAKVSAVLTLTSAGLIIDVQAHR